MRFAQPPLQEPPSRTMVSPSPFGSKRSRTAPINFEPDFTSPRTRTVVPGSTPMRAPWSSPQGKLLDFGGIALPVAHPFGYSSLACADERVGRFEPPTVYHSVSWIGSVFASVSGGHT